MNRTDILDNDSLARVAADTRQHMLDNDGELVFWGEKIVTAAPVVIASAAKQSHESTDEIATAPPKARDLAKTTSTPVTLISTGSKAAALASLHAEEIGDCHRCPLGDTRIKLVFGVGNPEARVMFVGEGPGFDEDRLGEPFVGKAGQLLDKIMAAIGLSRTNAYIANVVKCHPMKDPASPDARGNDRPPSPEEMDTCLPFLKKQISIIRPEIIVTLGSTSTRALLGPIGGITALRGRIFSLSLGDGTEVPVLPTFHPAALLRDPELKKPVWEDMKMLRDRLKISA